MLELDIDYFIKDHQDLGKKLYMNMLRRPYQGYFDYKSFMIHAKKNNFEASYLGISHTSGAGKELSKKIGEFWN